MRRITPLAALLCAAAIAVTGCAGYAGSAGSASLSSVGNSVRSGTPTAAVDDPSANPMVVADEPGGMVSAGGHAPAVTGPALVDPTPTSTASPASASTTSPPVPPHVAHPPGTPATPAPGPTALAAAPTPPRARVPQETPRTAPTTVKPPYRTVLGWHGSDKIAYLSFDDGPGPSTGRILDELAGSGVKATFCEVGQKVVENPALVRRIVTDGHTLCNHSWDHHSPFDALTPADIDAEIGRTQQAMAAAAGTTARYFRAPQGRFGPPGGQILLACQRARTIPLAWGVDSLDWKKPGVAAIVSNVLSAVTPGAVILLHDGGGDDRQQTIAALPGIISGLRAAGYTLAALPADPVG